MAVSIFKNKQDLLNPHYISINSALSRIKNGSSKATVIKIREKVAKGEDYSDLKNSLVSVVFGGECREKVERKRKDGSVYYTMRLDECVSVHSGFFVLDFDDVKDIDSKMSVLKNDVFIYSAWVSPSGKGIKALVKCPPELDKHKEYYSSFIARYPELDTTSRNISRLCYESYDPELWVRGDSKVWNRTAAPTESNKEAVRERRNSKKLSIAVDMIRASVNGEKHDTIIKAGNLIGGYIASNMLEESNCYEVLEAEIKQKAGIKDVESALKALQDGIEYGKTRPISDAKSIEKKYEGIFKRSDGTFDFIADKEEMDTYLKDFISGNLEMGLSTGIPSLDNHWMVKRNTLVWWGGLDNVGKSSLLWYVSVLCSVVNDWRFLIFSGENNDGQVRKKLIEYMLGKSSKSVPEGVLNVAIEHIDSHFKIISNKHLYTWEELLLRGEIVFDEGWEYDCLVAEPYNAMDIPKELDEHRHNKYTLNILRVFKENYCSVWVADHANTSAARTKDENGDVERPWKASIDGGQLKANKVDDFIMVHRLVNHNDFWKDMRVYVDKVKDTETGGKVTKKDSPVILRSNPDLCGFTCMGKDAIYDYWENRNKQSSLNGFNNEW